MKIVEFIKLDWNKTKIKCFSILLKWVIVIAFLSILYIMYLIFKGDYPSKDMVSMISSIAILWSALTASFGIMANQERTRNSNKHKRLKFVLYLLNCLEKNVEYSISWLEKEWNETEQEEYIRVFEMIKYMYEDVSVKLANEDLIYEVSRGVALWSMTAVVEKVNEIYKFAQTYDIKEKKWDVSEGLKEVSTHLMFCQSYIEKELEVFEKEVDFFDN